MPEQPDSTDLGLGYGLLFAFYALIAGTLLFLAGRAVGEWDAICEEREKAVDAGVGKFVTDPKTGKTEFKYGKD